MIELIKDIGLRITPQRTAVLEAIRELIHPTAEEIVTFVRKHYPNISTATIYNTVDTLIEKDVLRRISVASGAGRFDINIDPHFHLISEENGEITDCFDKELLEYIKNYIENKYNQNIEISNINLNISGKIPLHNNTL